MSMTAKQDRLLDIIAGILNRDPRALPDPMNVKLAEQLDADSLDAVEICIAVEEEFSITIDDDEIDALGRVGNTTTPATWWKLIEAKLADDTAEPSTTVGTIEEAARAGLVPGLTPEVLAEARAERVGGQG